MQSNKKEVVETAEKKGSGSKRSTTLWTFLTNHICFESFSEPKKNPFTPIKSTKSAKCDSYPSTKNWHCTAKSSCIIEIYCRMSDMVRSLPLCSVALLFYAFVFIHLQVTRISSDNSMMECLCIDRSIDQASILLRAIISFWLSLSLLESFFRSFTLSLWRSFSCSRPQFLSLLPLRLLHSPSIRVETYDSFPLWQVFFDILCISFDNIGSKSIY